MLCDVPGDAPVAGPRPLAPAIVTDDASQTEDVSEVVAQRSWLRGRGSEVVAQRS